MMMMTDDENKDNDDHIMLLIMIEVVSINQNLSLHCAFVGAQIPYTRYNYYSLSRH